MMVLVLVLVLVPLPSHPLSGGRTRRGRGGKGDGVRGRGGEDEAGRPAYERPVRGAVAVRSAGAYDARLHLQVVSSSSNDRHNGWVLDAFVQAALWVRRRTGPRVWLEGALPGRLLEDQADSPAVGATKGHPYRKPDKGHREGGPDSARGGSRPEAPGAVARLPVPGDRSREERRGRAEDVVPRIGKRSAQAGGGADSCGQGHATLLCSAGDRGVKASPEKRPAAAGEQEEKARCAGGDANGVESAVNAPFSRRIPNLIICCIVFFSDKKALFLA
mmetsp:Transcript_3163/g.8740  ORF Transcript_3163/g.8740 Transcript_3163/m.8740 type:complete len:275 (-) Transcript_3163:1587-2411(-)